MRYQNRPENDALREDPKSPETLYEKVQEIIDNGIPAESIGALEMFLAMHPNFALGHNDLGVLYYGRGEKENALRHYERAAKLEPYNDVFQKNLADFYYVEAGRMGEALQIYVKILEMNPTDIETLYVLGQICVSLEKPGDARMFFNKVLELEPWNVDAREKLDQLGGGQGSEVGGQRTEDRGQRTEVGAGLGFDAGGFDSAEKMYQNAQDLMKSGREGEGISALERLLESYPDFGLAHNDLGVLYFNQGLKEKALEHYERAARVEPYNDVFQKNLADFYYVEAGRMGEALQIYVKLLDANPTDIETLLILGQICVSLEKMDDAKLFFNKVLELEPWNVDARERLDELGKGQGAEDGGQGAEDGGRRTEDGGQRTEDSGLGSDVGSPWSIGTRVESSERMYQTAQGLINDNRKIDAVDALEKLVASYPDHAFAHNDLGVLYFSEGDKEKSLQHYQKAASLEPQNPVFQKTLADFYYAVLGQTEEARGIYVKVLEANPNDVETLLILGHICVSLRRFDDAATFYNNVLDLEPWNLDAQETLDQLGLRTVDGGRRTEDGGQRTEDGGQRTEVGGQRTEDGGQRTEVGGQGGQDGWMDEGMKTDLGGPVVDEDLQLDSSRFILSLILSSENSERLIRNSDEGEESAGILDQMEIVVESKSQRQNGQSDIQTIQRPSKNILYIQTGEEYPQNALDALEFVVKRFNNSRDAAAIREEIAGSSASDDITAIEPDLAERFISLFQNLLDALKKTAEPLAVPDQPAEVPAPKEKKKKVLKKSQGISNDDARQSILNRIVKMKDEEGLGWKGIAEVLNSEGLPTFSGKGEWHRKTIYKMYQKITK